MYNPEIHHRHSNRKKGHDYSSPGWYYITICLNDIRCILSRIEKGNLVLMPIGEMADMYWKEIPDHYPNVQLDKYVIMPDHMHGILQLHELGQYGGEHGGVRKNCLEQYGGTHHHIGGVGHGQPLPDIISSPNNEPIPDKSNAIYDRRVNRFQHIVPQSLGAIVNQFKGAVKRWCNKNGFPQFKWQRDFHDDVITDMKHLYFVRQYIMNNPAKWK